MIPPQQYWYQMKAYVKPISIIGVPPKFWPQGPSRGWRRWAEVKIFGLNGSFWLQRWSLMVPDSVWPPGPFSSLEAVKIKFVFGLNDSFWPQRGSLTVPDCAAPSPLQDPVRPSRSLGPPRSNFFCLNSSFWVLTSASIPDGPWQYLAPRTPKLKPLQYGCLWHPFDPIIMFLHALCALKFPFTQFWGIHNIYNVPGAVASARVASYIKIDKG